MSHLSLLIGSLNWGTVRNILKPKYRNSNRVIVTINVRYLFLYGAGLNYFDFDAGKIHYKSHWKGWVLKIGTCLGLEMVTSEASRYHLGPKKSRSRTLHKSWLFTHSKTVLKLYRTRYLTNIFKAIKILIRKWSGPF
jgi:hypothetical protein